MIIAGYRPRNAYLERQLDRRWRQWVAGCVAAAAALATALGGIVAARQTTLRLRYEIAQLKGEVEALERERRALQVQLEEARSPTTLGPRLGELGLAPLTPERLLFLTPAGELRGALFSPPGSVPVGGPP